MPISKEKKKKIVADLIEKFTKSNVAVLTDYKGLDVSSIQELRKEAFKRGIDYKVAKNTLFAIAAKDAKIEIPEDTLNRPVAISFGYKDEVDSPKLINELAKNNENLEIIGGIIDGKFVSTETVLNLANLPSKEELYAKIVGSLAAPLRGVVTVLQGNLRGLASVLNQYKEKIS